jgi:hypothetical protein
MAVGDIKYLNGKPVRVLSTGTTPTVYWKDGKPVIVHEYSAEGGTVFVPYYYMMNGGL